MVDRDAMVAVGAGIHVLLAGGAIAVEQGVRRKLLMAAELAVQERQLLLRLGDTAKLIGAPSLCEDVLDRFLDWPPTLGRDMAHPSPGTLEAVCLSILKQAGLLPLGLLAPMDGHDVRPLVTIESGAILGYPDALAASLQAVVEARVPLRGSSDSRFVSFRANLGGPLHHAILVGRPETQDAPLCRLHSECFTGDIFASMRCDCGEQLDGAIARMDAAGGGIILYLSQEGRGIGLVNKLRAYALQDSGLDTVDANTQLGFAPDERNFACAARMLDLLGTRRVHLLTNNPLKIEALRRGGIEVVGRVEHSFAANHHNRHYLETKARRSGHLLTVNGTVRPE